MKHPLLYEINTRCWLRDLSDAAGARVDLSQIPEPEFERWQDLGFTHIWLMGVWTTSTAGREQALRSSKLRQRYNEVLPDWQPEDVGGSPYAIGEYNVPEDLGGNEGLATFRRQLHEIGMKLILDFVPNHVGIGHSWLQFWPELFVEGRPGSVGAFKWRSKGDDHWIAHGKDPYFPAWADTAQLDYRRPETHRASLDTLKLIATQCDGVRCDMAMLILREVFERTWEQLPCPVPPCEREFWPHAIQTVREQFPDFLFLAEAYWDLESELLDQGFDYTYDKWLADHLKNDNVTQTTSHLSNSKEDIIRRSVHFLENHDESRAADSFDWREHRTAAVLACCLPGMRLLHEGQLSGAKIQPPVQLARRPREERNDEIHAFYTWLLRLLRATAVGHGDHKILTPFPAWSTNKTHQAIMAIQWQNQAGEFDLVVINLADHDAQCFVNPEIADLGAASWRMTDLLSPATFTRSGNEIATKGLYLALTPRAHHIYHFTPA